MESNAENIKYENSIALLNDEQQGSEEINRKILCQKNVSNELENSQENSQYTTILRHCKVVHIGPKIEYHNPLLTTPNSVQVDLLKNSIFVKCKEILKNRYITNYAHMRSFFWEGKRNDLSINDYFVELIVEKSSLLGKKEGEKVNLEEIFSKKAYGHWTILFSGGPGYGKTTLCKKIAYDWAADETSSIYLKHFDLAVVILLRELGDKSLYNLVLYHIFQNAERELKSKIEEANLNILVMLDGFDEISNKSSVLKFIREDSFDISLRMTILVTSRTEATEDIREDMMSRFSIEGFSEQQQHKYIELMFKDYEDKGKELFSVLKENEFFSEIRKCPLMLHMLCCLYINDDRGLMESVTDLYIRMFSLLIKRYLNKNGGNYNFRKGKYFLGEDLLIRLGKLYLNTYEITSKDLNKHFPIEEEYNFIVGLGIIEFYSFSAYDEHFYYQFVHFSFKEFIEALISYFDIYHIYISDNNLLFMMGLSGTEPFPEILQHYFRQRHSYTPEFMLQAYREIKVETNWELFCSFSRLIFSYSELVDVKALLSLYKFTQFQFCFPENKSIYEKFRDKLIDFYNNLSDKSVIVLFPIIHFINIDDGIDFREIMSCIIDFFHEIEQKSEIYFCGICFCKDVYFFRSIKLMNQIPDYTRKMLNADENQKFVALQFLSIYDNITDLFITTEQYEVLHDRIRCFPVSNNLYTVAV